jgi:hypothetical protein
MKLIYFFTSLFFFFSCHNSQDAPSPKTGVTCPCYKEKKLDRVVAISYGDTMIYQYSYEDGRMAFEIASGNDGFGFITITKE